MNRLRSGWSGYGLEEVRVARLKKLSDFNDRSGWSGWSGSTGKIRGVSSKEGTERHEVSSLPTVPKRVGKDPDLPGPPGPGQRITGFPASLKGGPYPDPTRTTQGDHEEASTSNGLYEPMASRGGGGVPADRDPRNDGRLRRTSLRSMRQSTTWLGVTGTPITWLHRAATEANIWSAGP